MRKYFIPCALLCAALFSSCTFTPKGVALQSENKVNVFTLDHFEGKYKIELERGTHNEGYIAYKAQLSEGKATVSYDLGLLWDAQTLFTADAAAPMESTGGYIENAFVTIVIECAQPTTGEIIIEFMP